MSTTAQRTGAQKDVRAILTEKVIEKLVQGIVPWRVSWTKAGIPQNLISGNAYKGINRILLACLGYPRNMFLTSKQLKEIGGTLIPDERPHMISYLSNTIEEQAEMAEEPDGEKKPMHLRYYTVFNVSQCSMPERVVPEVVAPLEELQPDVKIQSKDQKAAFYDPLRDFVNMPNQKAYASKDDYCVHEFHQLIHSTGHHSRLNRKELVQMSEWGYDRFSHEELVAEIGASYLMSHFGLEDPFKPTAEYMMGWIDALSNDTRLVYSAAHSAEKAINYLFIGEVDPKTIEDESEN